MPVARHQVHHADMLHSSERADGYRIEQTAPAYRWHDNSEYAWDEYSPDKAPGTGHGATEQQPPLSDRRPDRFSDKYLPEKAGFVRAAKAKQRVAPPHDGGHRDMFHSRGTHRRPKDMAALRHGFERVRRGLALVLASDDEQDLSD